MLKIAVHSVEVNAFRVRDRRFFPHRPNSSSDACQHADMAESCYDEGWEKYSALYFFLIADDEKRSGRRGSDLSSMRGLAGG